MANLNVLVLLSSAPTIVNIVKPPDIYTEMPPVLMPVPVTSARSLHSSSLPPAPACGWNQTVGAYFLPTGYSALCLSPNTSLPVNASGTQPPLEASDCSLPVYGLAVAGVPPGSIPANTDWRRNYYGIFSADRFVFSLDSPPAEWIMLATHGENNNELWNGLYYQNSVNVDVPVHECYSGEVNGTFVNCMAAYNAFVGAVLLNTSNSCYGAGQAGLTAYIDVGPIAWPLPGYLNATGGKASYGLRHPGILLGYDAAVYVSYLENALDSGAFYIVRAAQGPDQGLPTAFLGVNASTMQWGIPSLPSDFNSSNVAASFASAAPGAAQRAPAFSMDPAVEAGIHMSMARMPSLDAYLAVIASVNWTACDQLPPHATLRAAQYEEPSRICAGAFWQLSLRVSVDMITWSAPAYLPAYGAGSLDAALLRYPTLLSADGSSQTEIDPSGFYIMGTCSAEACAQAGELGPAVYVAYVSIAVYT